MKTRNIISTLILSVLGFISIWVHLEFLKIFPDPFFTLDSGGYFQPAVQLFYEKKFDLLPVRTPLYPLFIYLSILGENLKAFLFVQHVLAFATGALTALIAIKVFKIHFKVGIAMACLVPLFPRHLVYSHCVMTETLYSFLLLAAVLCFFANQNNKIVMAVSSGLVLLCLATRPVALALFLSVIAFAVIFRNDQDARSRFLMIGITLFSLLAWSSYNYFSKGFFNTARFSGLSLFGTTARYLMPERIKDSRVRQALGPFYQAGNREKLNESNWVRYAPDGPVAEIKKIEPGRNHIDHQLLKIGFLAISHRPALFLKNQIAELFQFLFYRSKPLRGNQIPKEEVVASSLSLFGQFTEDFKDSRRFMVYQPQRQKDYFERIHSQKLYPYDSYGPFHVLNLVLWGMELIGPMFLISTLALYFDPANRRNALFLCLIVFVHVALNNLGADLDGRHAMPLEPLYLILIAIAGQNAFKKLRGQ